MNSRADRSSSRTRLRTAAAATPAKTAPISSLAVPVHAEEEPPVDVTEAAMKGAVPHKHNAYKIELAKRAIVRALTQAAQKPESHS